MKRLFALICLLTGATALLSAQEVQPDASPHANLPVVQYRSNDSIGRQLDYANTVCDTLLYNGEAILLDESPLMQLNEVKELVRQYQTPLPDDCVYNCQRGYTAQWEIRDNQIYLVGVTPFGNNYPLLRELSKLKIVKSGRRKPLLADWVSGSVTGGADAVRTDYGYAFKKIHRFLFKAGVKQQENKLELPTGSLENEERLTEFLQQHKSMLYDAFYDAHFIKMMQDHSVTATDRLRGEIPLKTDIDGKTDYLPPGWRNSSRLKDICFDKSMHGKILISQISLANAIPQGSFYPRFLRTGIIYQPTYIQYYYALLYQDIAKGEFTYCEPSIKRNTDRIFPQ